MKLTIYLLIVITLCLRLPAQVTSNGLIGFHFPSTDTNTPAAPVTIAPQTPSKADDILPLVEMHDVPITTAIETLTRQEEINYLFDPAVYPIDGTHDGAPSEPSINCHLKTVTAKFALYHVLNENKLILVQDPVSGIAIITSASQATNTLFASMGGSANNPMTSHTNKIPLISFSSVPISMAIESLARQENEPYMLDPGIDAIWHGLEPSLNIRLENVTGWNTLNRILNLHGLILIEDPITHIARITPADKPQPTLDPSAFGIDTNNQTTTSSAHTLIQFSDVTLDTILTSLAKQGSLRITLDPRITGNINPGAGWFSTMPTLSLRWEDITPVQALMALCRNYDLIAVKHPATGVINIEPMPNHWKPNP